MALILTLIKSVAGVCEQVIVSFPPEGYTGTVKIKVRSSPDRSCMQHVAYFKVSFYYVVSVRTFIP